MHARQEETESSHGEHLISEYFYSEIDDYFVQQKHHYVYEIHIHENLIEEFWQHTEHAQHHYDEDQHFGSESARLSRTLK
ncbi:hypothetical protein LTR64_004899 [Lithohypha guttulata]|uniref:uncharacterized protein n=1 Tax=Lithohypha guttulata TaxID=1690604 RepID=UPI002DDFF05E|nr:hypothetical protein LTR51_005264 [Lithohypha guttulata]